MSYKLTEDRNGNTEVIKKAGSDYVRTSMPVGMIKGFIETADKVDKSERFNGFGIAINGDEMYFAGELLADEKPKIEEKTFEDPKPDVKNFGKKFHPKKKH